MRSIREVSQARVQRQRFGLQDQEVARVRPGSKEVSLGLESYIWNEKTF